MRASVLPVAALAVALLVSARPASPSLGGSAATSSFLQARDVDPPAHASRYLPLGHWAYRYIDLLVARGRLTGLAPLVQPYRRIDLADAIRRAGRAEGNIGVAEREWMRVLEDEFQPELRALTEPSSGDASYLSGDFSAGTWAVSDRHRDLLRPEGRSALFPFWEADLGAEFPAVAAALRFRWDQWFVNDPQFPDGIVVEDHPNFLGIEDFRFAGRAEDGYLELQLPYFQLLVGRTYRNWGLPGIQGLLVSSYPYSYDQVGYRLGTDRLSVTGFVAQLDEFPNSVKRWFSAHRLDWRVRDNLSLALGEGVTYGGENRGFDFRYSNPISIWLVGGFGVPWEDPNTANNLTELSAWWRPWPGLVTYFSAVLDQLPDGDPAAYAGALGLHFPMLAERVSLRLDYSQVSTLAYRTPRAHELYAFRNLGLGRDLSDHDLLSLRLDWFPHAQLIVSPAVYLLRRGEGDLRQPWPSNASGDAPVLFTGEVETTLRLGLVGTWRPGRRGWVEWDLGQNFLWDVGHEPGRTRSQFAGRLRLSVRTRR